MECFSCFHWEERAFGAGAGSKVFAIAGGGRGFLFFFGSEKFPRALPPDLPVLPLPCPLPRPIGFFRPAAVPSPGVSAPFSSHTSELNTLVTV